MTNGINTLKAADNGLTSITTTIQSMQATVTQARQDASWQSSSYYPRQHHDRHDAA